jgi:hypothetical protein
MTTIVVIDREHSKAAVQMERQNQHSSTDARLQKLETPTRSSSGLVDKPEEHVVGAGVTELKRTLQEPSTLREGY